MAKQRKHSTQIQIPIIKCKQRNVLRSHSLKRILCFLFTFTKLNHQLPKFRLICLWPPPIYQCISLFISFFRLRQEQWGPRKVVFPFIFHLHLLTKNHSSVLKSILYCIHHAHNYHHYHLELFFATNYTKIQECRSQDKEQKAKAPTRHAHDDEDKTYS